MLYLDNGLWGIFMSLLDKYGNMKLSIFMKCIYGANVADKNMKIMEICEFCNFQPPYLHDKNLLY